MWYDNDWDLSCHNTVVSSRVAESIVCVCEGVKCDCRGEGKGEMC